MKKSIPCALLAALLLTQGCCSVFTSEPQVISVDSEPKDADVRIGPHVGKTPYTVTIPRGRSYVIKASYGGATQTKTLDRTIEPLYFLNILLWPGLIVDLATGNMYRYEPTTYKFHFADHVNDREPDIYKTCPVISYRYDASTGKGTLSVDITGRGIEARQSVIDNIGKICADKNIALVHGKNTNREARYLVLNESVEDGILTIEFEALY